MALDGASSRSRQADSIPVSDLPFVRVLSVCTRQQEPTGTKNESPISNSLLGLVVGACLESRHESLLKTTVLEKKPGPLSFLQIYIPGRNGGPRKD